MEPNAGFDEDAVTRKLVAVRRRDRLFAAPRLQVGAALGLATLAAVVLFAGGNDVAAIEHAPVAVTTAPKIAVTVRPVEPVLASSTSAMPALRGVDHDDAIILFDDEPESEAIVILEDPPARVSWRAAGRARAREAADGLMRQAVIARGAGDNTTARRQLTAALTASPAHAPAAAALAEIHIEQRKYGAAVRYAKRAARAAPDDLDYKLLLGDAYDLAKNRSAARKVWRDASARGSSTAAARLQR